MKYIIQYQIEVAICLAAFAFLYLLLWRKETNFLYKRYLLLAIPLFSIIIPLIDFNIDLKPTTEYTTVQYITYLPNQLESVYMPIVAKSEQLSGWEIAFWIFIAGAIVMLLRLLISYIRILQIYRQSTPDASDKFRVIDEDIHSFSFFNIIVLNKNQASSTESEYILAHENAHKKQGHSWDILWLEIVKMLHWFNPMIWLLTRESKKNLEYLADQKVADQSENSQNYQLAIVQHASQSGYHLLKTQFSKTNLKNRIIMMNRPNNHKITSWKLITMLPVLMILLMSFSINIRNLDLTKELAEVLPSFNQTNPSPEKILEIAEVFPAPDGQRMHHFYQKLYEHIEQSTGYGRDEIEGKVIIHFIVNKDGSLKDLKLIEGINETINEEVLQFVKDGPSWTPGLDGGQKVNVRMVLPIQFRMKERTANEPRQLTGKLINEQEFTAITGVKVKVGGTDIETHTDEAGMFKLNLEPHHKELVISSDEIASRSIKVHPEQVNLNYLIRLDKSDENKALLDSIYNIVDEHARPLNMDMDTYYDALYKDMKYPEAAREKGIEGKVFVEIIIQKDGKIRNARTLKEYGYGIDVEAVRLIEEGPSWEAGKHNGTAVNSRLSLFIKFGDSSKIMEGTIRNDKDTTVFSIVEDQPKPAEGDWTAYYESINASMNYPQAARDKGIEGKVFVQFIVRKDGSLSDLKVVKGISKECDAEAIRVIKEGPKWIAGEQRGTKVNVRMILPISFIGKDKITGTVLGNNRKPIPGANVVIKGTTSGTVTDNRGSFILKVEPDHEEIIVSSKNYLSQSIRASQGENYTIQMKPDPANPPATKLSVTEEGGGIVIRSNGEDIIDPDKKPLYLVDGKEIENFNDGTFDPDDIESISVLKGSSATELYGEKGKNGIILITTKKNTESNSYKGDSDNSQIVIRGIGSFDGENAPLILVNGEEISRDDLRMIDPKIIESIEVLKDQTLLEKEYGDRGRNGVIKIKTKEGTELNPSGSINEIEYHPSLIIVDGEETNYSMEEIDKIYKNDISSISVIKSEYAMEKYGKKGENGVVIVHTLSHENKMQTMKSSLERMPEYKKGTEDFYRTFQKKLKYPQEARMSNVQGKVLVSFTVTKTGEITDIKADETEFLPLKEIVVVAYAGSKKDEPINLKKLPVLEQEVIRILKSMGDFNPGIKNGEAVDVRMTLPVVFKLS